MKGKCRGSAILELAPNSPLDSVLTVKADGEGLAKTPEGVQEEEQT